MTATPEAELKIYLPSQVIKELVRYLHDGCELEMTTEDFKGEQINRWIANGKIILWSAPVEPPEGRTE